MRIGVILPTFRDTPDEALETAARAEALDLDGVFCYDHVWPMGQRERPALAPFPVLGLLAGTTKRVALGTLVARVGLVPPRTLIDQFATLDALAPGRVIAAMGVGDSLSKEENLAYGIEFAPADIRLEELRRCAMTLTARGIPVWLGGRRSTRALAAELGVAANLWDAPPSEVADQATLGEVTWAGPTPTTTGAADTAASVAHPDADHLVTQVAALEAAGATWAVFGYPAPLERLAALRAPTADG
jgi:alkanesulfonate monooxygenase SsuD/methylene tetrahydromethanopterin reductase-like flavin-dependent oxidoreductase (luciferase family)